MKDLSQQDVLKQYDGLVRRIAHTYIAKLPANVELDDLIQVGRMGLLEAHKNYVTPSEATFETFSTQRVRGSILDYLREMDWLSRGERRKVRVVENTRNDLENTLGRAPRAQDIAIKMGMTLKEYFKLQARQSIMTVSISQEDDQEDSRSAIRYDSIKDPNDPNPENFLLDAEQEMLLKMALNALPEKERNVISLRIDSDLNMKEIGAIFGVTESRICQLYAQAIRRCNIFIRKHEYGVPGTEVETKSRSADKVVKGPAENSWRRFNLPREFKINSIDKIQLPEDLPNLVRLKMVLSEKTRTCRDFSPEVQQTLRISYPSQARFLLPTSFALVSCETLFLRDDFANRLQNKLATIFDRQYNVG
jgi:RNA polymerase sigma factor for flagellar operon FliA